MSGNSGVKIETLGKDNYDTWKLQAEALLTKNDSWCYVSGEVLKPEIVAGDDATTLALRRWETADRKARSDLILAISPPELKQIKHCETSREIWLKLQSIYQSKGPARKATLLKRLTLIKMKEGDCVREHIAQFFDTVDKLGEMELDVNEDLLTIMLLYSLPESFENFRCAIESRDELPKPEALKVKIIEEYEARKAKEGDLTQNAMFAGKKPPYKKIEKPKNDNWKNEGKTNVPFKFKCHRCRKPGHKAADCRTKLQGAPHTAGQAINKAYAVSKPVKEKREVALLNSQSKRVEKWCLDSGCTSHMSSSKEDFDKLMKMEKPLNLANESSTMIEGVGEIKLSASNGSGVQVLKLQNALHVPDLRTNLLSVAKITDKGYEVVFRTHDAVILKPNQDILAIADRDGDLYFIRDHQDKACIVEKVYQPRSELEEWHYKLGHLNEKSLKEMGHKETVLGLNLKKEEKLPPCEICIKGKQTQTPFPKGQQERTTELLQIVHSDVCGPMRVNSLGGARYLAIFVDDKSRWCEVYFLKKKSEIIDAFKDYKSMTETQTGMKIKTLQSDNGTEYCNNDFDKYLKENGIQRRLTVPHTPQQNGIAERKNRTLVETARCNMMQANSPPAFWAEAISTANYVRNRCSSRALNGETPYKTWTGKRPTVSHFQIFGSKVFALNKNPQKGKFDSRSTECTFVGYSNESKAYRLWSPKERKIIVSRDVKFINEFNFESNYEDFLFDKEKLERRETGEDTKGTIIDIDFSDPGQQLNVCPEEENGERLEIVPEANVPQFKRGPGRPAKIRTGAPGRPRKQYNLIPVDHNQRNNEPEWDNECANLICMPDPINLEEALSGPDAVEWETALKDEYSAQIKCKTWEIVDRPKDRKILGSRFVLQTKLNADGEVERRKARLVAKGFSQTPDRDFHETFAPVAKASTIRLLMALAVEYGLTVHQMDVVTAYLNGEIGEEIYMELPDHFEETLNKLTMDDQEVSVIKETSRKWLNEIRKGERKACLVKKALYGLKQSGRQWYRKLDHELKELGMKPSNADPCMYISQTPEDIMLIAIYVDDILIASNNVEWITNMKLNLMQRFEMKDLGPVHYCLGIEFTHSSDDGSITMSQRKYTEEILERFGMKECKPISTPLDANCKLQKPKVASEEIMQEYPYQSLIGSLMYLAVSTRPDIAYTVSCLSQFNTNYGLEHWVAAKRVLRYLKGTSNHGLVFSQTQEDMTGFVDADWGSCVDDRRSYTGYVFKLAGTSISWEARKQRTVALSSTEAEYMALSEATKEAIYLQSFLEEVGFQKRKIVIYNDNQGAQKLVKNPVFHSRTKHIDIRYHFIREAFENGKIDPKYMPTEQMVADVLTKGLFGPKHHQCTTNLGVMNVFLEEASRNPSR